MKKIILYLSILLLGYFIFPINTFAHRPELVYLRSGDIQINNPELSWAFYDELKGEPRNYFIDSNKDFELYLNLLVPEIANKDGRYSAKVFLLKDGSEEQIGQLDGKAIVWEEFYEEYGRDYYLKGPELTKQVSAGKYKIEVYSDPSISNEAINQGKYVLAVGKTESYDIKALLNVYWQLPLLKMSFFKTSVFQFFLTPFGIGAIGAIGGLLILIALIYYLIGVVKEIIKHNQAKTLLLASSFPEMKDEIIKLLQKPAYDVNVTFITTASKPEENTDYMQEDLRIMREELRFNVQEFDIEGKTEHEVMKVLELDDIIFVEGGNTFYLLKAMRACNFEKIIRKLLKLGKVYIGGSAGSMVAGRTITTSVWRSEFKGVNKNVVGLKNLKGLNLVPFDIFVHYQPEHEDLIKQKMPNSKQRAKKLRILTDGQAILVQGKEVDLIGEGEAIII